MYIVEKTLDDVLKNAFGRILKDGVPAVGKRGNIKELTGVLLEIENPRSRLSLTETKGKIYSAIGELLWYLSGTDDLSFIVYYISRYRNESEDQRTVYGAYGPRLLRPHGSSQIENILRMLKESRSTKRAVIQIFDRQDVEIRRKEAPCTCTLQFLVRNDKVNLIVNMRSNDAYFGLPHDVFAFTMIQELVASCLGCDVGTYKQMVGSLHLYEDFFTEAAVYDGEGFQPTTQSMPPMPDNDPLSSIAMVLRAEEAIRVGKPIPIGVSDLDPYWGNIVRLLQIFRAKERNDLEGVKEIQSLMSTEFYNPFIERTKAMLIERA